MARRYMSKVDRAFYRIDREETWKEQGKRCFYCKCILEKNEITFDHVIPISKTGGQHRSGNCVVACWDCNQAKGDSLDYVPEVVEKDEFEQMIADAFDVINEGIRQWEYTWEAKTLGSYNKWVKYWEKRHRWD